MRSLSLRSGLLSVAAVLAACRDGSDSQASDFIPVVPSFSGTQGCGPSAPVPGLVTPVSTSAVIGAKSQIAAASDTETLYLTSPNGVYRLVFPATPPGGNPTTTLRVSASSIENALGLAPGTAVLSGIAVLDEQFLVVAEHTSNTLLAARRDLLDTVFPLAGLNLPAGGYSDGQGGAIRFHFTEPVSIFADAIGLTFVADTENHAVRQVEIGGIPVASTITGSGAPGDDAGELELTELDTPSGMASSCPGELLLTESGNAGFGGNRLISLAIGGFSSLFGGFEGTSLVLAGDGTNATTQGVGTDAQLGTPMGLVSTQDGLLFWVDAKEGILRRYAFATGLCDCPPFVDCATAVASGGSFSGDHFSLALGQSGRVYVLETFAAGGGMLYRVDP
jgi:hypothetical protein